MSKRKPETRERKPETLPLVQRFLRNKRLDPFAKPVAGAHYTKELARQLEDKADYRVSAIHGPDTTTGPFTDPQLRRVSEILQFRRWEVPEAEAAELDAARHDLEQALNETEPDLWDPEQNAFRVHPQREQRIAAIHETHPCLERKFRLVHGSKTFEANVFAHAYKMLQAEHKDLQNSGKQLHKELNEGGPNSLLHERLRWTISKWKRQGKLPSK